MKNNNFKYMSLNNNKHIKNIRYEQNTKM
jgi:hypothetical protein